MLVSCVGIKVLGDDQTISSRYVGKSLGYLDFAKGFKSDISEWQPFIDGISLQGRLDANLLSFNDPGEHLDFAADDDESLRRFILQMNRESRDPRDKRIFGTHSWGATRTLQFLYDEEWASFFCENYDGLVFATPFMGSHFQRGWGYGPIARTFSKVNGSKPVGSTVLEQQATKRLFRNAAADFSNVPTHDQSLYLDAQAVALLRMIEKNGLPRILDKMPMSIMIGDKDTVCKNPFIERLANALGVEPDYFEADHYLLLKDEDAMRHLIQFSESVSVDRRLNMPLQRSRRLEGHGFNIYPDDTSAGSLAMG